MMGSIAYMMGSIATSAGNCVMGDLVTKEQLSKTVGEEVARELVAGMKHRKSMQPVSEIRTEKCGVKEPAPAPHGVKRTREGGHDSCEPFMRRTLRAAKNKKARDETAQVRFLIFNATSF
jgi:uncharacterized membrane protein YheB (UPF0754 family)